MKCAVSGGAETRAAASAAPAHALPPSPSVLMSGHDGLLTSLSGRGQDIISCSLEKSHFVSKGNNMPDE